MANAFADLVKAFQTTAEWIEENLGDAELAQLIRDDLGLAPGAAIPQNTRDSLRQAADALDPDQESFLATVDELAGVTKELIELGEALRSDQANGWDVAYLIARTLTIDVVRVRSNFLYGLGKLLTLISEDPEAVEELDPALLLGLLKGQAPPEGTGEAVLARITALSWLVITVGEALAPRLGLDPRDAYEAYYGWDRDPSSTTPIADQVSGRAITLVFGPAGAAGTRLSLTVLGVPSEHRGPGLFLSVGGAVELEHKRGDTSYKLDVGATGALDLMVGFGKSDLGFVAEGDAGGFVQLDVKREKPGQPALLLGKSDGTRIEVQRSLVGIQLAHDRAGVRLGLEKATLVIDLAEGDGLLASLPGGEIRVEFGLVLTLDTAGGLRIEGGTQARAILPVNFSLFGVFTVHHLELALGPSAQRELAVELSGAFSLHLGPFGATVDRAGMLLDAAVRQGNLGFADAALGFKSPSGIGLAIDVGIVKGGGYLNIDEPRGEYSGALELTIGPVGVKAIGILSTKVAMPDGSQGWALLLLVYGQFAPIQLSFGFTLTGVGGMIGLHHGVSIDSLTSGVRDGVLDDVLFPENPVSEAPRIINRLRTVFPTTPRAITFGPMLELGWGTPAIVKVRLGIIVQLDNVLPPGNAPVSFSRLVVIGQLRVQMLPAETKTPPLLKLLVDILGYYDAQAQRLGFLARLRDSKVAEITLSGMLVVQADFGDQPSFVLAAGGFHPRFKDIPVGTPAPIDRIGVGFAIGPAKLSLEAYFALTPSTVQGGAHFKVEVRLGPVSVDGWLGFDAIFYFQPRFYFEVDVQAGVAVKFMGHNLLSVQFKGTLAGPGLWRIAGSVSFSILFWDIEKSFDVTIGSAPDTPPLEINVAALVQQALEDPGNWGAQMPVGNRGMVSLGEISGEGLLAHPLGSLTVVQRVAPFGLTLQRFGSGVVAGPNRFDVQQVSIGTARVQQPGVVTESFTRAHFVDMTEEEKLTLPSFDRLAAGVSVGTGTFRVPQGQVRADLQYETHYLEREPERDRNFLRLAAVTRRIGADDLVMCARHGAVSRSAGPLREAMRPAAAPVVTVSEVPLAAVRVSDLGVAKPLDGQALFSSALAHEALRGEKDVQLVEAFEGT